MTLERASMEVLHPARAAMTRRKPNFGSLAKRILRIVIADIILARTHALGVRPLASVAPGVPEPRIALSIMAAPGEGAPFLVCRKRVKPLPFTSLLGVESSP